MKRLLIICSLLIAGVTSSHAQEHIDALLTRDIEGNRHGMTLRSAVKRDPGTGEIIKRVYELSAIDHKSLAKEFIEAFKRDRESADVWDESENGSIYNVTAVWQNPKRVYSLAVGGSMVTVYAQIIYREDKQSK